MDKRSLPLAALLGLVAGSLLLSKTAQAAPSIQLQDNNASLFLNFERASFEDEWIVDTIDSLFSQKVFLGLGNSEEYSYATLSDFQLIDIVKPAPNRATVSLLGFNNQLKVDISTVLVGQGEGTGRSRLRESYTLTNLSDLAQNVDFYYYQDFEAYGTFGNDLTRFAGKQLFQYDLDSPTGRDCIAQISQDPPCNYQTLAQDSLSTLVLTADQTPDSFEVSPYRELLVKLFSGPPVSLDSQKTTLVNGDGTAALQYNRQLEQNGKATFRFDKRLRIRTMPSEHRHSKAIPEPTMSLALLGVAAYLWKSRRRSETA